jgi:hypothetical protein
MMGESLGSGWDARPILFPEFHSNEEILKIPKFNTIMRSKE